MPGALVRENGSCCRRAGPSRWALRTQSLFQPSPGSGACQLLQGGGRPPGPGRDRGFERQPGVSLSQAPGGVPQSRVLAVFKRGLWAWIGAPSTLPPPEDQVGPTVPDGSQDRLRTVLRGQRQKPAALWGRAPRGKLGAPGCLHFQAELNSQSSLPRPLRESCCNCTAGVPTARASGQLTVRTGWHTDGGQAVASTAKFVPATGLESVAQTCSQNQASRNPLLPSRDHSGLGWVRGADGYPLKLRVKFASQACWAESSLTQNPEPGFQAPPPAPHPPTPTHKGPGVLEHEREQW